MKKGLYFVLVFIFFSCEKDPAVPIGKGNFIDIATKGVTNVLDSRASTGISITNVSAQYAVQERGVCWSTNSSPTVSDANATTSMDDAEIVLRDLVPGQKYYVRSFAKINGNYTYGNQEEFTTSATNSNLSLGLVTLLPLNGDSRDYTSSGNSLTGIATKSTGRYGINNTAFAFNGTTNYLTLLAPKNIPVNNAAYSISVWFRATVWNREMTIMGYGPSSTSAASNYVKTLTTRGMMHYHWNLDNLFSNSSYTNQWTHLVITYDGAGTERYYVNGQLVYTWPHTSSPLFINPTVLSIGARVVNASINDAREYFSGSIDELRIYNRALSAAEVSALNTL
jgi:hypothetical protein